jgi:hypothetical protein
MDVHFNDTRAANASAAKLWEVVTDYASYPTFNAAIINVRVADLLAWLRLFLCGRLWNYADPFVSEPLRYLLRYLVSVNGHVHRHLRSGLRRWLRRKEPQQGVDDHQQQHVIRRDPHIVLGNHLQPVPDAGTAHTCLSISHPARKDVDLSTAAAAGVPPSRRAVRCHRSVTDPADSLLAIHTRAGRACRCRKARTSRLRTS